MSVENLCVGDVEAEKKKIWFQKLFCQQDYVIVVLRSVLINSLLEKSIPCLNQLQNMQNPSFLDRKPIETINENFFVIM